MMLYFMKKTMVLIVTIMLIASCSSFSTNNSVLNTSPHLPATDTPVDIVVNKTIDLADYQSLIYVKMNSYGTTIPATYADILIQSLSALGDFDQVVTHEAVTYINARPRRYIRRVDGEIWYDNTDPLTFPQLKARYQDFIIAEATLREFSPVNTPYRFNNVTFELKFIDPNDGRDIILFRTQANNANNIEYALINPAVNAAMDWLST